jgi:hypothetical protein
MPFIQTGNLVDVAAKFLNVNPGELGNMSGRYRIQLERFLRGTKVLVRNTGGPTVGPFFLLNLRFID